MEPSLFVQVTGAVLILFAYALLQTGRLGAETLRFDALNLVGASLLAWEAWRTDQYGFLLLEGTWALISAVALVRRLSLRKRTD